MYHRVLFWVLFNDILVIFFPNRLFVAHSLNIQLHPSSLLRDSQICWYEIVPGVLVYPKVLFWLLFYENLLFSFPNRLFVAHSLQPDSFTQALFSEMHKLAANKSGILAKFLQPLLIHHKVPSLVLSNKVTMAAGIINEPVGGSDNPLRFTAGLALSVFMDCELENVQDLQRVQVQVNSTVSKERFWVGVPTNKRHTMVLPMFEVVTFW